MKKYYILFILLSINSCIIAQIKHTVKEKETLYGLSKKYNVSMDDLRKANPKINNNTLKIGDDLIIPTKESIKGNINQLSNNNENKKTITVVSTKKLPTTSTNNTKTQTKNPNDNKNTTNTEGEKNNSSSQNLIKNTTKPNKTENKDSNIPDFLYIKIAPKETLYRLSKKYKTDIETIKKLNPNMNPSGPKIDEILKIPNNIKIPQAEIFDSLNNKSEEITTVNIPSNTTSRNTITQINNSDNAINTNSKISSINTFSEDIKPNKKDKSINVLLILPFHSNTNSNSIEKDIAKEFYSGAQIALDSLINKGRKINLTIWDNSDENKFNQLINNYNFSDTDLIIGPLFKTALLNLVNKVKKVPIVSPFSTSDELDNYENLIIYSTKEQTIVDKLSDEILKKYSSEKIYIVYDDEHYNLANYFKSLIYNKYNNAEVILTKNPNDIKPEQNLVTQEYNKVYAVILSENEVLLKKYLDNIILFENNWIQPISLSYSTLFDNDKYENKLLDLGLIYADTKYVNESEFNEQKTLNLYKKKYCNLPGKYAITGFDTTYDILNRIDNKGRLSDDLMAEERKQLSNKYFFSRIKKNGAWSNQGVRIIQLLK